MNHYRFGLTVFRHDGPRRLLQVAVVLVLLTGLSGLMSASAATTDRLGRPVDGAGRALRTLASAGDGVDPLILAQAARTRQAPFRPTRAAPPVVPAAEPPPRIEPAAAAPTTAPLDLDAWVNLDFRETDIKTIIKFLSEQTGTNYLFDESVKGTVTLVGPRRVTVREAVWLLESLLEFRGFSIVQVGDFKKVIPQAKAQGDIIETRTDLLDRGAPPLAEDRTVTQLLRLRHTNVNDVKTAISGLLARPNGLIVYPPTNTLIITENALNIERVVRIIQELDTPVHGKNIYVVPVRHSLAKDLATKIETLLKQKAEEKLEPETRQVVIGRPAVIADERTNSLVVVCLEGDLATIRVLVEQLDRDVRLSPSMRVIPLTFAKAEDIVGTLERMLKVGGDATVQGMVLAADKRTNTVLLSTLSPSLLDRAVSIIKQLDGEVAIEEDVTVRVHRLEFAEAEKVADLLKGFEYVSVEERRDQQRPATGGTDKGSASNEAKVSVIPDKATNSLIITCPKARLPYILDVISHLDVVRPQVLVEVLIVEIAVTRARQLGLDFNILDTESSSGNRPFAIGNTDTLETFLSPSGIANGLNFGILTGSTFDVGAAATGDLNELSKIAVMIRALQNDTRANILSAPQLVTSDNEPARISVGEQIQIPSSYSTAANTGLNAITSFSTEDLGIILEITPRITNNDHVVLKVTQTIKARTNDTLYDQNIPVISKRDIETNITTRNNTTIVIGGLLSENENEVETRIPVVSKLPLIGKLFRDRRKDTRKTNLMVFLTPHILRGAGDAVAVTSDRGSDMAQALKKDPDIRTAVVEKLTRIAGGRLADTDATTTDESATDQARRILSQSRQSRGER